MNKFLKAVGFSKYQTREQIEHLYKEVEVSLNCYQKDEDGITGKQKEFFPGGGLVWVGSETKEGFRQEYCIPYAQGTQYIMVDVVSIEEKIQGNLYSAAIEDLRIGVFLIFHLVNGLNFRQMTREGGKDLKGVPLTFSALSVSAKVILPLAYTRAEVQQKENRQKKRIQMIAAAKMGDEKAMENLAYQDMNTYTQVAQRMKTEDLFAVVESSFMPYGIECDKYAVVADIEGAKKVKNEYTGEFIWKIRLNYNGIFIDVCIHEDDLLGEPARGRRFKGIVWLQGIIKL